MVEYVLVGDVRNSQDAFKVMGSGEQILHVKRSDGGILARIGDSGWGLVIHRSERRWILPVLLELVDENWSPLFAGPFVLGLILKAI